MPERLLSASSRYRRVGPAAHDAAHCSEKDGVDDSAKNWAFYLDHLG